MNIGTFPDNVQETISNLAALLRAKKALAKTAGAMQQILSLVNEEETTIRGSLQSWVRSRLQLEYGVTLGQWVAVNRVGESAEGQVAEVRLTFRFTDVTAVPLLEVTLQCASGQQVVIVLDSPTEVLRIAAPRLALVA